jgi:hypothetical protein
VTKSTIAKGGKTIFFDFESDAFNHSATLPSAFKMNKPTASTRQMIIRSHVEIKWPVFHCDVLAEMANVPVNVKLGAPD